MEVNITSASFLFYQKVKVAIAVVLIKLFPQEEDILEYVYNFQYRFRRKAKNCNLFLEKRIFSDRILLLLPALKVYTLESHNLPEPMEIDDDSSQLLSSRSYATFNSQNTFLELSVNRFQENYLNILHRIQFTYWFLDALLSTESLCDTNRKITRTDVSSILSKIRGSSFELEETSNHGVESLLFVSRDLLRYLYKSVQVERVISTGISFILKLLMSYFEHPNELVFHFKGFSIIIDATNVMLNSIQKYNLRVEICDKMSIFIRKSLAILFVERVHGLNEVICDNWYTIFGPWKKWERTCVDLAEALISVIKQIVNMVDFRTTTRLSSIQFILVNLRRVLISYCQLHAPKHSHYRKLELNAKPCSNIKHNFNQWERILSILIVELMSQHESIVRSAWSCLKIVLSLKMKMKIRSVSVED